MVPADAVDTRLLEAFNRGDWDTVRTLVVPDLTYEEPSTGRRVQGAEDYVRLCQGWRRALPDCTGTLLRAVASEDTIVLEVRWEGTHTGPMETPGGTLPPTGRRIEGLAVLWNVLEGDRIREVRHHLDMLTLLQQIGVIAPPQAAQTM